MWGADIGLRKIGSAAWDGEQPRHRDSTRRPPAPPARETRGETLARLMIEARQREAARRGGASATAT
jgi:hypothetical protein